MSHANFDTLRCQVLQEGRARADRPGRRQIRSVMRRLFRFTTCAGIIACDATILAAAAAPHGRAILQTHAGELLLYDVGEAGQLSKLGSFPEPCPSMHILPHGKAAGLPAKPNFMIDQHFFRQASDD